MIGVDTSVVVRYLVGEPPDQAKRAAVIIDGDADVGISILVIVEAAHVLRSNYELARSDILDALIDLVSRTNLIPLELSKADVMDALVRARAFPSSPLQDALIAASARAFGALPVFTFDERFGRLGSAVASP